MSEPGRIWRWRSATAEVRVKRRIYGDELGAPIIPCLQRPLEPAGMVLCRVRPHDQDHVVFLMSFQWLVMAPRPNVAAKLATVGLCHMRAW